MKNREIKFFLDDLIQQAEQRSKEENVNYDGVLVLIASIRVIGVLTSSNEDAYNYVCYLQDAVEKVVGDAYAQDNNVDFHRGVQQVRSTVIGHISDAFRQTRKKIENMSATDRCVRLLSQGFVVAAVLKVLHKDKSYFSDFVDRFAVFFLNLLKADAGIMAEAEKTLRKWLLNE